MDCIGRNLGLPYFHQRALQSNGTLRSGEYGRAVHYLTRHLRNNLYDNMAVLESRLQVEIQHKESAYG